MDKIKNWMIESANIMFDDSKGDSYQERIKKIEQGKLYLKANGFFSSKSNLLEDVQRFIHKISS